MKIYERLTHLCSVEVFGMGHGDEFVTVKIGVRFESGKRMHTLANQCFKRSEGLRLAKAVVLGAVWLDRAIGVRRDCGYPPLNYPSHQSSIETWDVATHAQERADLMEIQG